MIYCGWPSKEHDLGRRKTHPGGLDRDVRITPTPPSMDVQRLNVRPGPSRGRPGRDEKLPFSLRSSVVERLFRKQRVVGSSPAGGSIVGSVA